MTSLDVTPTPTGLTPATCLRYDHRALVTSYLTLNMYFPGSKLVMEAVTVALKLEVGSNTVCSSYKTLRKVICVY